MCVNYMFEIGDFIFDTKREDFGTICQFCFTKDDTVILYTSETDGNVYRAAPQELVYGTDKI